ncbi:hypothetical protein FPV67DRAFT_884030 [Lyophyllum atratum]|nr:hypothetical protein FPV67DRAFT_884030 [Lyophyllum atratum]
MASESFDSTVGAFEIGVMVSLFLFGLVTVQTFSYYKKFPNDPWQMRTFVAIIWTLELAHTALTAHSVYWMTVINYGRSETLMDFSPSLIAAVVLSGIIGPSIQAFFAHRVHRLSRRLIIPCICWLLSVLRCISVCAVAAAAHIAGNVIDFTRNWKWLLASSLAISTVVDVLIAGSLCFYLWHGRESTFQRTKRMVDRLIVWSIQTGLLTSIGTLTMLILFLAVANFAWIAVFFIISRLFSNSLMATLNARASLRDLNNRINFIEDGNNSALLRTSMAPRHDNTLAVEMTKSVQTMI